MPDKQKVNVTAAKGRPMLTWVGKKPLSHVTAFPSQHVETHDAFGIHGVPSHDPETGDPPVGPACRGGPAVRNRDLQRTIGLDALVAYGYHTQSDSQKVEVRW
jgi:hypothetical protein